jgi:hypothetical protein
MVPLMKWQAIESACAAVLLLFLVLTGFASDRRRVLAREVG